MLELPSLKEKCWSVRGNERKYGESYIRAIRRLSAFLIILTDFVEVVFIQLSNETRKIAVFEMFREDEFGELLALQEENHGQLNSLGHRPLV